MSLVELVPLNFLRSPPLPFPSVSLTPDRKVGRRPACLPAGIAPFTDPPVMTRPKESLGMRPCFPRVRLTGAASRGDGQAEGRAHLVLQPALGGGAEEGGRLLVPRVRRQPGRERQAVGEPGVGQDDEPTQLDGGYQLQQISVIIVLSIIFYLRITATRNQTKKILQCAAASPGARR